MTVERIKLDVPTTLAHLATAVNVAVAIDALEPQFTHYALLKRQLSHYRALASEEGINDLPALPGTPAAGAPAAGSRAAPKAL